MIKTEIRLSNPQSVSNYMEWNNFSSFSIGDEGCLLKLPDVADSIKFIEDCCNCGKMARIVIPFIPQRHLETIKKYLLCLSELYLPANIVINDYGVLFWAISTIKDSSKLTFGLGRFLERSFGNIPWHEAVLHGERPEVAKMMLNSSFADDVKLDFFGKLGVKTLEMNTCANEASYKIINEHGIGVGIHYGINTLAFSRVCHKRLNRSEDNDCRNRCDSVDCLLFTKKWASLAERSERNLNSDYQEDAEVGRWFPQLMVKGNGVYKEEDQKFKDILLFDKNYLIIDEWYLIAKQLKINDVLSKVRTETVPEGRTKKSANLSDLEFE